MADVYLSLGNNAGLENNTFLTFPDIGTKAPHQMVCTSDKMPCCRDPTQYGVWKFPNGSLVNHISEGAMAFHSDRDNFGNVNLYRVHDNVTSPGGQFCCEIEDATNTNQTLCVIIGKWIIILLYIRKSKVKVAKLSQLTTNYYQLVFYYVFPSTFYFSRYCCFWISITWREIYSHLHCLWS